MIKYGKSPWLDRFPRSRVPSYPKHRGPLTVDAVIIGGGLTGCATAYALGAAGMKTVLLEADQIGRGATARSSGWIADDPGVRFDEFENIVGRRSARRAWLAWRRAALDFAALLRRLDVKCHLEAHGSITAALTPEQLARLRKDQKARVDAGIEAPFLNARATRTETGLEAAGALRAKEGGTLDPYRACLGLAAAAADRQVQLFERSAVRRITFTRKHADVFTAGGTIRTRRIVVATGMPRALFRSLARHFWFHTRSLVLTEAVPAKIRQQMRAGAIVRDLAAPPHVVRWVDEAQALVQGADSESVPERQQAKAAVQRTGQLMYELSTLYPDVSGVQPAYGWMTDYARTVDGLPYIGPHRNFPHHFFAFGDASHGVTGAYLASRILLRQCSEEMDPADEAFGFHRSAL